MHATESIDVQATPEQTWQVLSNLERLPEWYVPAQRIERLTEGAVREGWQFNLAVKTLPGIVLKALGTVTLVDSAAHTIVWQGQALGISGDSRWQIVPHGEGQARINHTFEGQGWLMFLSHTSGRNRLTVQRRLANLKQLVEREQRS